MSTKLQNKKALVKELVNELTSNGQGAPASTAIFNYSQIQVNEFNVLRDKLLESQAKLKVVKNSLIEISLQRAGVTLDTPLTGQNAILLAQDDLVGALKVLFQFIKEKEKGQVVLGVLNNKVITGQEVEDLSKLPSREQLIGQVLAGFNTPIRSFVFALNDTQSKFVRVLNAIKENKS